MKRRTQFMLSVILAILLIMSLLTNVTAARIDLSDESKTVVSYGDWILEKINGDTQWELDEYVGSDQNINTPRFIDGLLVVSFGNNCFANNKTVESVITSSPLWVIGDYAFIDCTALKSFEFNYGLHTIGIGAFSGTTSLTNINLETSVIKRISTYAFADSGLTEVTLPDTCETIEAYAFLRCVSLEKITIPDSVTSIHEDAFKNCTNLVIYCSNDSYAHEYAEANGIEYVLLDETVTFICGDADGDGEVTIIDATRIQRVLAELDEDSDGMITLRGDSDEDGLNIMDATTLQRYLASYAVTAPVGETLTRPKPVVNA